MADTRQDIEVQPWTACPLCGHEGYHEYRVDTGQIPGADGDMIDVRLLTRTYPHVNWRCILCGHRWWTPLGEPRR